MIFYVFYRIILNNGFLFVGAGTHLRRAAPCNRMKIGIYTNSAKDRELKITRKVEKILQQNGFESFRYNQAGAPHDYAAIDALVVIGGDGTILCNAVSCMRADIPLVTINKGTMGFLTEVLVENIDNIVDLLHYKNTRVEERSMLKASVGDKEFYALNEILVCRKSLDRLITISVEVEGNTLARYKCDGFIVSTPTGSTGYSLSCGGSLISPRARVLTLTPICCTSLAARPVIIDDDEVVKLKIDIAFSEVDVICDGNGVGTLKEGQALTITDAGRTLKFLRSNNSNFYSRLFERLS